HHFRYTYLCSQQNVLFCLRHRTIGSSHNQDSTIHLSSTSNHIYHVVSVTGTIHVCIVTSSCLIFHVSGIDSNTSFFFFRSSVNIIIFSCLSKSLFRKDRSNSCGQSSFTMVNVTNSTNV